MPHFKKVAAIINSFPINFVVCTNTIGNALIIDPEASDVICVPCAVPTVGFPQRFSARQRNDTCMHWCARFL
jgi:hypothetical protein